jgi:hypothetical protein
MTTYTPPPEPGRTASRRSRPVRLVIGILLPLVGFAVDYQANVAALTWRTSTRTAESHSRPNGRPSNRMVGRSMPTRFTCRTRRRPMGRSRR